MADEAVSLTTYRCMNTNSPQLASMPANNSRKIGGSVVDGAERRR